MLLYFIYFIFIFYFFSPFVLYVQELPLFRSCPWMTISHLLIRPHQRPNSNLPIRRHQRPISNLPIRPHCCPISHILIWSHYRPNSHFPIRPHYRPFYLSGICNSKSECTRIRKTRTAARNNIWHSKHENLVKQECGGLR